MLKISYAGWVVLVYHQWLQCSSLFKCVSQMWNRENKTPILGVQGRSKSSMLVPPESSSAVLVMMGSKTVPICNRFHARLLEVTRLKGVYPHLMSSYWGVLERRVSKLVFLPDCDRQTNRQTDGQAELR